MKNDNGGKNVEIWVDLHGKVKFCGSIVDKSKYSSGVN